MKVDRSILPPEISTDRKEGLYAELGPEGQVLHVGFYQDGQLHPGSWVLEIAPDGSWARALQTTAIHWRPELSSQSEAIPPSAEAFARQWIHRIIESVKPPPPLERMHCAFCGKNHKEVKRLIAGPNVYICDECVGMCQTFLDASAE